MEYLFRTCPIWPIATSFDDDKKYEPIAKETVSPKAALLCLKHYLLLLLLLLLLLTFNDISVGSRFFSFWHRALLLIEISAGFPVQTSFTGTVGHPAERSAVPTGAKVT